MKIKWAGDWEEDRQATWEDVDAVIGDAKVQKFLANAQDTTYACRLAQVNDKGGSVVRDLPACTDAEMLEWIGMQPTCRIFDGAKS